MPKRRNAGPPYTDIPEEAYVVVTNPWGMSTEPRRREQGDFNRIASWAQFVLHKSGLGAGRVPTIECIYSMGTRDEIIIQFEAGTDIIPLLGEHRWADFCTNPRPNDHRSTRVFVYDWRRNGDPTNHNWSENFPQRLPLESVPAKSPYPPPSWTSPPSTLTNFVLSIPRALPPPPPNLGNEHGRHHDTPQPACSETPLPPSPHKVEQPEEGEEEGVPLAETTNLFAPYQPPSQHPSHARFVNQQPARQDDSPEQTSSPPKFIKKLDPYEQEEDAFRILRSPDPDQEDNKETVAQAVPPASSNYQPSSKLENEVNAFLAVSFPAAVVKSEPVNDVTTSSSSQTADRASSSYRPSATLEAEVNALLQHRSPPPVTVVKREPEDDVSTTSAFRTISSGYQPSATLEAEVNALFQRTNPMSSPPVVKSEPQDGPAASLLRSTSSYQPSTALESEINAFLHRATNTASSRVAVKREYDEDLGTSLGQRKKIKVEG